MGKQQRTAHNIMIERWQQRCLIENGSLFTEQSLWTAKQLEALQTRLQQSDARGFDEKWQSTLLRTEQSLHALLLEVLYMYYLFPQPDVVRYDTKVRKLTYIIEAAELQQLDEEAQQLLQRGIGHTTTLYCTRKYDEVLYMLQFARALKSVSKKKRQALLQSPWEGLKRLLIEVRQTIGRDVYMQHIIAHFLAPAYYECIASGDDKMRIVEAFKHYLKHDEADIDRQLYDIRQELQQQMTQVDFYASPLYEQWQASASVVQEQQASYEAFTSVVLEGLVFEQKERLRLQIETALKSGKHLIFTGPPGTGKSKLATRVCEELQQPYMRVTASANWSAYETIGGYRPTITGELQFHAGIFLQALKPKERWLIIDELNRANMDEAFGPLFSVLAGDAVTLPYTARNGEPVVISPYDANNTAEHMYGVSQQWRMIGTMNTRDKAALFDVSYALMRRFAFIPIPVPARITEELMTQYLCAWNITYDAPALVAALWQTMHELQQIGPAIIEDVIRYVVLSGEDDFTSALQLYVVPQLDGVPSYLVEAWLVTLEDTFSHSIDVSLLRRFCEDFLQLERHV